MGHENDEMRFHVFKADISQIKQYLVVALLLALSCRYDQI